MEASDAAEWLLHAESDLTYAKLGQAEPAILRNQLAIGRIVLLPGLTDGRRLV